MLGLVERKTSEKDGTKTHQCTIAIHRSTEYYNTGTQLYKLPATHSLTSNVQDHIQSVYLQPQPFQRELFSVYLWSTAKGQMHGLHSQFNSHLTNSHENSVQLIVLQPSQCITRNRKRTQSMHTLKKTSCTQHRCWDPKYKASSPGSL